MNGHSPLSENYSPQVLDLLECFRQSIEKGAACNPYFLIMKLLPSEYSIKEPQYLENALKRCFSAEYGEVNFHNLLVKLLLSLQAYGAKPLNTPNYLLAIAYIFLIMIGVESLKPVKGSHYRLTNIQRELTLANNVVNNIGRLDHGSQDLNVEEWKRLVSLLCGPYAFDFRCIGPVIPADFSLIDLEKLKKKA